MTARPPRILSLSTLFPNTAQPRHGIFLEHRLTHLARAGADIRHVAPVPYFPFDNPRFGRYAAFARVPSSDVRGDIPVTYPRFPLLPKIGMSAAPWLMAAALLRHVRHIRRAGFDFDLIDAYYLYPDGVAAAALARILNKPLLLTAFGSDVSQIPAYALPRRALLWAVRQAPIVTAVCQALKDELVRLGVDGDKIRVIIHGVDLQLFHPPDDRAALRARLGMTGPTMLSVGHLIDRKGHDIAIRALDDLPGHALWIVGDGPRDGPLRRLAAPFGDRVRFLGHVDQRALPDLMGAADVLVNCSDREGIANVLIEAMATGTPVAATAVWGSPEAISTPDAGLLLQDRSPGAEEGENTFHCLAREDGKLLWSKRIPTEVWSSAASYD
ncbi:MAG: glycosyltransferase, partial [Gemmatimonadaceae bacterium]|nr:glycosyltransferase [Acetobacteraceae bacterium]